MWTLIPNTTVASSQQEIAISPSDAMADEHGVTSTSRSRQTLVIVKRISQHLLRPRSQTTDPSTLTFNADPQFIEPPANLSTSRTCTHDTIASIQHASGNSVALRDLTNDDKNDYASGQQTASSLILEEFGTLEDELSGHRARTLRRAISTRTLCSKISSGRSGDIPGAAHTLRRVSAVHNLCSKTISEDLAAASSSARRFKRSVRGNREARANHVPPPPLPQTVRVHEEFSLVVVGNQVA